MIGGAGGVTEDRNSDLDGARVGPPPDLPSLLLHNRIVYLGMPLVPAVTELIIAEVRWRDLACVGSSGDGGGGNGVGRGGGGSGGQSFPR